MIFPIQKTSPIDAPTIITRPTTAQWVKIPGAIVEMINELNEYCTMQRNTKFARHDEYVIVMRGYCEWLMNGKAGEPPVSDSTDYLIEYGLKLRNEVENIIKYIKMMRTQYPATSIIADNMNAALKVLTAHFKNVAHAVHILEQHRVIGDGKETSPEENF